MGYRGVGRSLAKCSRWQPLESILALLGALNEDIEGLLQEDTSVGNAPTIAIKGLWQEVISPILEGNSADAQIPQVMQARALLFAAAFAGSLPQDAVGVAFTHAMRLLAIQDGSGELPRMAAVKSIKK